MRKSFMKISVHIQIQYAYVERERSSNFNLESVSGAKILPLVSIKIGVAIPKWNIFRLNMCVFFNFVSYFNQSRNKSSSF